MICQSREGDATGSLDNSGLRSLAFISNSLERSFYFPIETENDCRLNQIHQRIGLPFS